MFCSKCGSEINNDVKFCSMCGNSVSVNVAETSNQSNNTIPTHHEIPKCNYCGNIAPWKVGPILRPMDFVIGVGLLLLGFIPGLVYLGVVALIRSNDKNREKNMHKMRCKEYVHKFILNLGFHPVLFWTREPEEKTSNFLGVFLFSSRF